jgi:hypothetical protein
MKAKESQLLVSSFTSLRLPYAEYEHVLVFQVVTRNGVGIR